ncbi:MAG TPA: hypothetical protein VFY93_06260 [Planctomycetota bacterium]|nr:hypothetical protein [Planctomycetota bacterium]
MLRLDQVLRLALPAISCAVLLWFGSDVGPVPRAHGSARRVWQALVLPDAVARVDADVSVPSAAAPTRTTTDDAVASGSAGPVSAAPAVRRQHDVRDLVALGFTVDDIARWTVMAFEDGEVTPRVNVVEVVAPEEAQLRYERLLDRKREVPYVLRIHPVADLVCALEELAALQEDFVVELRARGYAVGDPVDPENEPEPTSPFDIESLAEVIRATVQGVGAVHASGRNLLALADPATQVEIARFLDDLRWNVEQDAGPPTGPDG